VAIPLRAQLAWKTLARLSSTSLTQLPAEEVRAAAEQRRRLLDLPGMSLVVGRAHPDVLIVTKSARGAEGVALPVRVYRPSDSVDEVLPLVVYYHGGGFVSGDPKQSEWWCSSVAHDARVVVVSVDYRLAPEHRYPTPVEDCYAATVWAVERAADLGADGTRVAVMGDSAGGNLAAVVCLMARDRGGPRIALQVLLYPAVDLVNSYPSEDENEFAPILGKADLHAHELYCPGQRTEPYASPLFAEQANLPAALIQTAEHDPLRDQGTAYAEALRRAGVAVRLTNYVDAVHGYASVPGLVPSARQALGEAVDCLRAALAAGAEPPAQVPDFREQKALE
jgi:acetyl esterase